MEDNTPAVPPTTKHLTPKELQVLFLTAKVLHNKEIAKILNITEHTTKFHLNSIYAKTGQSTRLGAVLYGLKTGLLKLNDLMPEVSLFHTATEIAITEENKQVMEEARQNMIENIVNDFIEEVFEEEILLSKNNVAEKLKTILKEYTNA